MVHFGNGWDEILKDEFQKEYYKRLRAFLKLEYSQYTVYPHMNDIFSALKATDYNDVKAVILGQDPYHGEGQAHGMAFSVREGIQPPPSLQNMYKELKADVGIEIPRDSGYLLKWARSGVLLLNTVLTVRAGMANSHKDCGWEIFTDCIIKKLDERERPIVFLLWGNNARKKEALIKNPKHCILKAAHPSPLSAYNGFFGCKHFSKTNEFLTQNGIEPIDWQL